MAITWDWQLPAPVGAGRLAGVAAGEKAGKAAGTSTALCLSWLSIYDETGLVQVASFPNLPAAATNMGKVLQEIVAKPALFGDALPAIAKKLGENGTPLQLQGAAQDLNEKNLTKTVDHLLKGGRYLVFVFEKTKATTWWYTFAVGCTKTKSYVFDALKGQFMSTKSGEVAKTLLAQIAANNPAVATLGAYLVVSVTFDTEKRLQQKLEATCGATAARWKELTNAELGEPTSKSYFGRDFVRMVDRYQFVKNGKTIFDRVEDADPRATLTLLVQALECDFPVPQDDAVYELGESSGSGIEAAIAEKYKPTDAIARIFSLMSQRKVTDFFGDFRIASAIQPQFRPLTRNLLGDRFKAEDIWKIDVEIDAKEVKIIHRLGFLEGDGAPYGFQGGLILERKVDRKSGAVTIETPRAVVALT